MHLEGYYRVRAKEHNLTSGEIVTPHVASEERNLFLTYFIQITVSTHMVQNHTHNKSMLKTGL